MIAPHTPGKRTSALHDVLVVGAGIGGLTAAALAANDGLDTVVLEAHNRPGGCAGDFALGGVLFPAGATLLSGFEPGGLHDVVYRRLGLRHRAIPLTRAMQVVGPGLRLNLWTHRRWWVEEWRAAFPQETEAATRFFDWAETVGGVLHRMAARLPVLPPRAPSDVLRLAAALRPETLCALPYLHRTVAQVMDGFGAGTDPRFRAFIDAQLLDATGCTAETCAAIMGALALDLYHRGCFALPGGAAEIARDLVRALRRDGGQIVYNAVVIELRRDRAGHWSARTADGRVFRARTVITNVPVWDLPALLGDQTPRRLRAAVRLQRHGWGAFVLHAGVDPAVLPPEEHAYVQVLPQPGAPLTEGGMCFISVLPPARRPGAPRAVSVSTHTEAGRWWGLDRESYLAQKAVYAVRLLAACERAFPGFGGGLRFVGAATPRTFAHYTVRGGGLVGGLRQDRVRALFGAVSHRSGAPGLFLCGDTVFPGQGTIGVTLSGINAWRSARHTLGLRAGLRMRAHIGETADSPCDTEPLPRLVAGL
jgi:C-3',4' desaturase CrtD